MISLPEMKVLLSLWRKVEKEGEVGKFKKKHKQTIPESFLNFHCNFIHGSKFLLNMAI